MRKVGDWLGRGLLDGRDNGEEKRLEKTPVGRVGDGGGRLVGEGVERVE